MIHRDEIQLLQHGKGQGRRRTALKDFSFSLPKVLWMLQISPHAITISTSSLHAALSHWHHVALGLRPSVPVAPHALPVPPLLPGSGAVSVAHCHREHCSFLTPQPTRSLKLHFFLPQVFSQRGITEASVRAGSLTIALCDTYQSFQNRGAASQFQQSSKKKHSQAMFLKDQFHLAGILSL